MPSGDRWLALLVLAAALGSGLMAGTFFAFSTFVMKALAKLAPREGIAAMQSINVAVINPIFLGVFLGTTVLCAIAIVAAIIHWDARTSPWLLTGGALYVVATFGATMIGNVPLNNALAKAAPGDPDAAALWARYVRTWTVWNHVRTIAALLSSAALVLALRHLS